MSKSTQARYRWLLSQMRWHKHRAAFAEFGAILKWHASQAAHYETQIMRMWRLK